MGLIFNVAFTIVETKQKTRRHQDNGRKKQNRGRGLKKGNECEGGVRLQSSEPFGAYGGSLC